MKTLHTITSTLILLGLTGCGFQLAGTSPSNASFDSLFVENRVGIQQLIDQPVAQQLQLDIAGLSPEILSKAQNGIAGIIILNEENRERSLSLTEGLFERQVELEKRVQYQIISASGELLIADSLGASRELIESQTSPAAKYAEREILINAINRDISRQLIRRFSSELAKPGSLK